jgi:ricin-type beta-trefoil lectin protein
MIKRMVSFLAVVVTVVAGALWISPSAASADSRWFTVHLRANRALCLNNPNSSLSNNTQMIIYTCSNLGEVNERWSFIPSVNFPYPAVWLDNIASSKCLTTKNAATTANTPVIQYTCTDNGNEVWKPTGAAAQVDGLDYYVLSPQNAGGMCLAPLNSSATSGTKVVIQPCTYSLAQQWTWY